MVTRSKSGSKPVATKRAVRNFKKSDKRPKIGDGLALEVELAYLLKREDFTRISKMLRISLEHAYESGKRDAYEEMK